VRPGAFQAAKEAEECIWGIPKIPRFPVCARQRRAFATTAIAVRRAAMQLATPPGLLVAAPPLTRSTHVHRPPQSPIAAAVAAPITMREGTTTMNRTSVSLTLLALGLLLLLALLG
jgi:hypothetical protein